MRILICSNAYPPRFMGGAELVAHEHAKQFLSLGHEVLVFAGGIGAPDERHSVRLEAYEGVSIIRISMTAEDFSPAHLNFLNTQVEQTFREALEQFEPDVVHFHNIIGLSVKLPIIAKQAGMRTVCTLHDYWGFCPRNIAVQRDGETCDPDTDCERCISRIHDGKGLRVPLRFRRDMVRLCFEYIDDLVAPSKYVAARYQAAGLAGNRISVVSNGVRLFEVNRPEKPEESKVAVAFVGYFGAHKDVTTLISAIQKTSSYCHVELILAGSGPEEARYKELAQTLGVSDRIKFLGNIPHRDIFSVYQRADVVCLPSSWDENQPVCLMEAMSAGLPVVASRKGGVPELIEHGRNGLLFEAGNIDDLAAQLAKLCSSSTLRVEMGVNGRRKIQGQTYERQAALYLAIYAAPAKTAVARLPRVLALGSLKSKLSLNAERQLSRRHDRAKLFIPLSWFGRNVSQVDYLWLIIPRWLERLGVPAFFGTPIPVSSKAFSQVGFGRQPRRQR